MTFGVFLVVFKGFQGFLSRQEEHVHVRSSKTNTAFICFYSISGCRAAGGKRRVSMKISDAPVGKAISYRVYSLEAHMMILERMHPRSMGWKATCEKNKKVLSKNRSCSASNTSQAHFRGRSSF